MRGVVFCKHSVWSTKRILGVNPKPPFARKRSCVVSFHVNEKELAHLNRQVAASGLSREEYLRSLITGKEIHPRPCTHHTELVRQISGLCNNANQLAHRANSTGVAGQQSVDEMMRIAKEVWREIKENY